MDNEIDKELHLKATQYATLWPVHLHKVAYTSFIEGHSRITELLKEKDERISELLEALEAVIRLKPLIDYPNNTKEKHIGEAMAIGGMLHKVKTAIEKVKGYQNEISLNDET